MVNDKIRLVAIAAMVVAYVVGYGGLALLQGFKFAGTVLLIECILDVLLMRHHALLRRFIKDIISDR